MVFKTSKDLVGILQEKLGLDERLYAVLDIWKRELGPLAAHAEIAGYKKGVLVVDVEKSVVFHELSIRKRSLTSKINQHFGKKEFIKQIRLRLKE